MTCLAEVAVAKRNHVADTRLVAVMVAEKLDVAVSSMLIKADMLCATC